MPTLPAGTYQPASISYLDAGNERGSFHFYGKIITAANHDAQVTAWGAVKTAANALALGALIRDNYDKETLTFAATPTNGAARELSLQLIFQDATSGEKFRANLPTVNPALISYIDNFGAKDAVDVTTPEVEALISALEAFPVVNPLNQAHTVNVIGARVVRGLK